MSEDNVERKAHYCIELYSKLEIIREDCDAKLGSKELKKKENYLSSPFFFVLLVDNIIS